MSYLTRPNTTVNAKSSRPVRNPLTRSSIIRATERTTVFAMSPKQICFLSAPAQLTNLSARRSLLTPSKCASRTYRRASTPIRMGLIPFVPNWIALSAWAFGVYRFYLGFDKTSYQRSYRVPLALAWPLLFAINESYRKNFTKSIKGSDDSF